MKDFFYNGHDNSFALVADRWHLENLSTNWNCLNFRSLSLRRDSSTATSRVCVCLLTRTRSVSTASFPTVSSSATRVSVGSSVELVEECSEKETSRPPSFGSLTTAAPIFTNDFC